ncbi:MAG: hypothetical protein OXB95_13895 [Rhodobacteraceae bacterium]|nr:hypothetical protein [Paracoccaceae bacterium]
MNGSDRIVCRTPSPGKKGTTRIPKWKFDCIRRSILDELRQGDVAFSQLASKVESSLSAKELERLGSIGWHVTSVKLELECRGEIRRRMRKGRQVLTMEAVE